MKQTRTLFRTLFLLTLLMAAGGTFTSCVKQKNCKTTKRTFCVEGELHYISNEDAFVIANNLINNVVYEDKWVVEPSDIPQKYHKDGVRVRVSLLNQGVHLNIVTDEPAPPYRVKCIESIE